MKAEYEKIFYQLARPTVRDLEEYDPGPITSDLVRIASNENNLGVPKKALDAMICAAGECNRYADSRCDALRKKLGEKFKLAPEQFLISNGLDGVFTMLGRAFLEPGDEVVFGELTFSVYEEMAVIMDATAVAVPMTESIALDVQGFIAAVTDKTKMMVFCNPNNPTGTFAKIEEVKKILDAIPQSVIFVLDEAYIEFAEESDSDALSLLKNYPNLMVCRTFSKIFGLAGLRVGWIAAHPELLKYLYKVREPYCVSSIALAGAMAALDDAEFYEESRRIVREEKSRICAFLRENNIDFITSQANFILLPNVKDSLFVRDELLKDGIIVRLLSFRGRKILRVTIGLPKENRMLESSLQKIFSKI